VDYSQIDSGLSDDKRTVGAIVTTDYLNEWEGLSKEEYKRKKERKMNYYIDKLEGYIPGVKDEIIFQEASTAKTIERYTKNPEGTAYGFAQIPKQSGMNRIQTKSPLKNLYYASAWGNPGGGFTGAILGGYFCAKKIKD